ncbi:MAG: signal recognition particle-docking protein FtsY [Thiomicrorhabdus sp.]|jgi:fused signal recognition particle receptor|nr:signal recognition particle-docking protein FtsY [Thiomicrorhabdus sp.]
MFSFLRRKKKHAEEESVEQIQPLELPAEAEPEQTVTTPEVQPIESVETVTENSLVNDALQNSELQVEATPSEEAEHFNQEAVVASESTLQTEAKDTSDKEIPPKKQSFFTRLKKGLSKTRHSFTDSLATLVLGRKEIDDDLLEELEMILLTADVGIDATDRIIKNLTEQVSRQELKEPQALITALKKQLQDILAPIALPLDIDSHLAKQEGPFVILMVGINGVGKTTTIGKLAKKYQEEGKSVMLAAGDTFRAAAVEQLQTWGERNNVPVIAQKSGADSAAVLFDAIQSAKAKKIDILIADTAGRLHTQSNLMEELKKVTRVLAKIDATAPHEVMLVIDAGTGQNALNQAQQFKEAVNVSGITLTKLDGTAKGGIVFALAEQTQIPIRFIGVGESIDDLRPFESLAFTEALFDQNN